MELHGFCSMAGNLSTALNRELGTTDEWTQPISTNCIYIDLPNTPVTLNISQQTLTQSAFGDTSLSSLCQKSRATSRCIDIPSLCDLIRYGACRIGDFVHGKCIDDVASRLSGTSLNVCATNEISRICRKKTTATVLGVLEDWKTWKANCNSTLGDCTATFPPIATNETIPCLEQMGWSILKITGVWVGGFLGCFCVLGGAVFGVYKLVECKRAAKEEKEEIELSV